MAKDVRDEHPWCMFQADETVLIAETREELERQLEVKICIRVQ